MAAIFTTRLNNVLNSINSLLIVRIQSGMPPQFSITGDPESIYKIGKRFVTELIASDDLFSLFYKTFDLIMNRSIITRRIDCTGGSLNNVLPFMASSLSRDGF